MFTDDEKRVFQYDTGAGTIYADPLVLTAQLNRLLDGNPTRIAAEARDDGSAEAERKRQSGEAPVAEQEQFWAAKRMTADDATERLIAAARSAFGMIPFDPQSGQGATAAMCLAVLSRFWLWVAEQKKSGETLPTSAPNLAPGAYQTSDSITRLS